MSLNGMKVKRETIKPKIEKTKGPMINAAKPPATPVK